MDNYKIKVKDEAESKEAQELFFKLGYEWRDSKRDITNLDVVFIYAKDGVLTAGFNDHNFAEAGHKELTLPQLRDLVVLKGKDAELVEQSKKFITPDHLDRFQAAKAHLEGKAVQFMLSNGVFYDITDDSTVGIFSPEGGYLFRLKPTTLTVNAELPKPSREFQQNTEVYAVTYEFKTREERNAFADKLRGTNS
ncbi:hypothetical protein [Acinetobacter baumannii]|uniref:hypothetical protein n=1 Tax=Acinetobacter baumannii TaxID=470 RepID=UPI003AF889F8